MAKERLHLYEGMYVLSATLSDDAREKALEKLKSEITERGGEIKHVIEQGRKKLAYEIHGHSEGYYYIFYFECPSLKIKELWHEYHLNEDLVRFLTLACEEVKESLEFKVLAEQ